MPSTAPLPTRSRTRKQDGCATTWLPSIGASPPASAIPPRAACWSPCSPPRSMTSSDAPPIARSSSPSAPLFYRRLVSGTPVDAPGYVERVVDTVLAGLGLHGEQHPAQADKVRRRS